MLSAFLGSAGAAQSHEDKPPWTNTPTGQKMQ